MLKETVEYLEQQRNKDATYTYEIIIVDDGSRDNTVQVAMDFAEKQPNVDIRILALDKNRGKGGAVTQVSLGEERRHWHSIPKNMCKIRACYPLVVSCV